MEKDKVAIMLDGGEGNDLPNRMTNDELLRVAKEHDAERKLMKIEMEKIK